ncbi:thioesterase-like superfamily-domain-containing protein [Jimgerdemannia flammicorona]|uniref:Thioesterase-like superfamily-domain-containing protein n=1 Tax=Jimgerdemannia flammicorona TaxID=994334 RepID=A0A433A0N1_9FUNG|nr:thioesterase-like superfamily-domain-containing protein [Jimgerdemannia flammicorona]
MAKPESLFQFDEAIQTTFLGTRDGKSVYCGRFSEKWRAGDVPHGGYAASTMLNAARHYFEGKPQSDPIAVNAFYLSKTALGPYIIEIWDIKASKSETGYALIYATVRQKKGYDPAPLTSITQYDPIVYPVHCLDAVITFGNISTEQGLTYLHEPSIPPVRSTLQLCKLPGGLNTLAQRMVWHVDLSHFPTTSAPGTPVLNHTMAFADSRPIDLWCLPFLSDMIIPPPALLDASMLATGWWFPTMQMEVQFKRAPRGKEVACTFKSKYTINGRYDIDGELWDEEGRLVATTR